MLWRISDPRVLVAGLHDDGACSAREHAFVAPPQHGPRLPGSALLHVRAWPDAAAGGPYQAPPRLPARLTILQRVPRRAQRSLAGTCSTGPDTLSVCLVTLYQQL
jgi:hypothetical protein